jgi:hypothetical protein
VGKRAFHGIEQLGPGVIVFPTNRSRRQLRKEQDCLFSLYAFQITFDKHRALYWLLLGVEHVAPDHAKGNAYSQGWAQHDNRSFHGYLLLDPSSA